MAFSERVRELAKRIGELLESQLDWVAWVIDALQRPITKQRLAASDLVCDRFLSEFGDTLKLHHSFSAEPFTKDKFEHAFERISNRCGRAATRTSRGTPGADLTLRGERLSLKTQADASIRPAVIHISKFMELGKGAWAVESDLAGLRDQFLAHMNGYDRILVLRAFRDATAGKWAYELVEIPKALLQKASGGVLAMQHKSKQTPKPGYCTVTEKGECLFKLYFDGGTERKLQIKHLAKKSCTVHATWEFAAQ